jgi:hypothetical protein
MEAKADMTGPVIWKEKSHRSEIIELLANIVDHKLYTILLKEILLKQSWHLLGRTM